MRPAYATVGLAGLRQRKPAILRRASNQPQGPFAVPPQRMKRERSSSAASAPSLASTAAASMTTV